MDVSGASFAEREYNLRAAFPDHLQWFARWASESEAARSSMVAQLDVRYGVGPKQTLDIFPATNSRSTLLFIHGGFWRALDKADHSFVAPAFVVRGIGVAVINYDLCPHVRIGDIVEQCRQSVAWVVREGPRHGLASNRIVVAGHSAGGHLSAMLFTTDWPSYNVPQDAIVAGISVSGVFDLAPLIEVSFNTDMRIDADTARTLSPAHLPVRVDAPLLLTVGANETQEFIRQSWSQWKRWPTARPEASDGPLIIANRHHFSVLSELGRANSVLTQEAMRVIENA